MRGFIQPTLVVGLLAAALVLGIVTAPTYPRDGRIAFKESYPAQVVKIDVRTGETRDLSYTFNSRETWWVEFGHPTPEVVDIEFTDDEDRRRLDPQERRLDRYDYEVWNVKWSDFTFVRPKES
jgi:hypothetical protein